MFPPETRFLIVDDMPMVRQLLSKNLKALGFSFIAEAGDGQDAYKKLCEFDRNGSPFNVVICDWNMPKMTGLDLLKMVRGTKSWDDLPFFLLTTESEKAKIIEAVHAGVTDYLLKPVTPDTLFKKLSIAWQKKAS